MKINLQTFAMSVIMKNVNINKVIATAKRDMPSERLIVCPGCMKKNDEIRKAWRELIQFRRKSR